MDTKNNISETYSVAARVDLCRMEDDNFYVTWEGDTFG